MSVFIIAEAGVNHNGSIKLAKNLIDVASISGADAVKFQTFFAKNLSTKNSKKANYQKNLTNHNETQFSMLKKLELTKEMHIDLINHCKKKKIEFLSSPFDLDSIQLLEELKLKRFKIPSGEITNLPYLRYLGKLNKKIILSTGMSTIIEVKSALEVLTKSGTKKNNITVLHSNTEYPTPFEDVNLRAMVLMGKKLNVNFGYSDHTLGNSIPVLACLRGAKIIEKHYTFNRNAQKNCELAHLCSFTPESLRSFVNTLKDYRVAGVL